MLRRFKVKNCIMRNYKIMEINHAAAAAAAGLYTKHGKLLYRRNLKGI
jgi:hypothetical protein